MPTFDLGVGLRKKGELRRHGQLSSKQCSDLQTIKKKGLKSTKTHDNFMLELTKNTRWNRHSFSMQNEVLSRYHCSLLPAGQKSSKNFNVMGERRKWWHQHFRCCYDKGLQYTYVRKWVREKQQKRENSAWVFSFTCLSEKIASYFTFFSMRQKVRKTFTKTETPCLAHPLNRNKAIY